MTIERFGCLDTFAHTMRRLAPLDFVRSSGVCQSWYATSKAVEKHVFKPLHEQARLWVKDGKYNCKSWVVLSETMGRCHPRDLYTKYLGEPIGPNVEATVEQIEELCKFDRRRPAMRKFKTHQAIHIYAQVLRTSRENEIAFLDDKRRLQIMRIQMPSTSQKKLVVDLSPYNTIQLFQHHLTGKRSEHVFACVDPQVFEQYESGPKASSVVFVPRESRAGRNMTWEAQVNLLSDPHIAGIQPLLLLCGFDILETGTCAYGEKTCVRTPDTIQKRGRVLHLALGHYHPLVGASIYSYNSDYAHPHIGAVPCIAADSQPLALETLDLETEECSGLWEVCSSIFNNSMIGL